MMAFVRAEREGLVSMGGVRDAPVFLCSCSLQLRLILPVVLAINAKTVWKCTREIYERKARSATQGGSMKLSSQVCLLKLRL